MGTIRGNGNQKENKSMADIWMGVYLMVSLTVVALSIYREINDEEED